MVSYKALNTSFVYVHDFISERIMLPCSQWQALINLNEYEEHSDSCILIN